MKHRQISVTTYEGHRSDERPMAFELEGERIEVVGVLKAWLEEGVDRLRLRCFRVLGSDGHYHILCSDEAHGVWYLRG